MAGKLVQYDVVADIVFVEESARITTNTHSQVLVRLIESVAEEYL